VRTLTLSLRTHPVTGTSLEKIITRIRRCGGFLMLTKDNNSPEGRKRIGAVILICTTASGCDSQTHPTIALRNQQQLSIQDDAAFQKMAGNLALILSCFGSKALTATAPGTGICLGRMTPETARQKELGDTETSQQRSKPYAMSA
jgi:hypothetical protein